jgi:hypothetical protein
MNRKRIIIVFIALLALISFQVKAQDYTLESAVKRQETAKSEVLESYMAIEKSLITSDSLQAGKDAAIFVKALSKFKFKKLTLEEMNAATTIRAEITQLAEGIAKASGINLQRKNFAAISEKMWSIAMHIKPQGQSLYQQVCPMTGVTWISKEKEIKNPYYPKNMLTCGEIKNSI